MKMNLIISHCCNTALLLLASSILFIGCRKDTQPGVQLSNPFQDELLSGAQFSAAAREVPNEMLVKFKTGVAENVRQKVLSGLQAEIREHILTRAMESAGDSEGFYRVRIPVDVLTGVSRARVLPEVEYAEPNYIYRHQASSNDFYYTAGNLWGMYGGATSPANQYGSSAATQWALGKTGSDTLCVGIIDEGFMFNHADLSNNGWINNKEVVDGRDNDGNGYVDDIRGWDFVRNDNTTFDGTSDDHGTHVAGTIGAEGGNSIGVAGVCWKVKMISGKFLGNNGGTTANAVKAVDYMTQLKNLNGVNIIATNNSWGGGGYSKALFDAIERANAAGILFIAAAGNASSNIDVSASYPAAYPNSNIIAVASITSGGGLSSFSNYGATQVDIGAPGSGILSTLPATKGGSTYGSYSGTSMAAPHVTGACVLYKSMNTSATAAQIKAAILSNSTPTSSLNGKCVSGGRLNVAGF